MGLKSKVAREARARGGGLAFGWWPILPVQAQNPVGAELSRRHGSMKPPTLPSKEEIRSALMKNLNKAHAASKQGLASLGGLLWGGKVFLHCHGDEDSFYSVLPVQGHPTNYKGYYKMDEDIVCYFCFPAYGICVALRPGDILVFNPQVPHCVSSQRNVSGHFYVMSLYLKTKVHFG